MPVGAYQVTVTHDGFAPATQEIVVASGSAPILHFQLAIGAVRAGDRRRICAGGERGANDAHHHHQPQRNRRHARAPI